MSENCSYWIQDEVQGHLWLNTNGSQSDDLLMTSFCVLSDDLEHDAQRLRVCKSKT